ncbi:MAG: TVP38/TMEM64 family protein [Clostridia bacterium]|nr:TVP38/TMEM64 family protein [Clostridia bacterium]
MVKENTRSYMLNFSAFLCFLIALVLVALLQIFQNENFMLWYSRYTDTLRSYEEWIKTNGATFLTALLIWVNYSVKAYIPWVPITFLMLITGAVFQWYEALLISAFGMFILFSFKYYYGKSYNGGNAEKILAKFDKAHNFIESGKTGSVLTLFISRLMPGISVNAISQLYGTTDIKFTKFTAVSFLGYSYKLFSYTIIGKNVYDPISPSFILPVASLFIFSGIMLLMLNGVINITSFTIKTFNKEKRKKKG